MCFLEKSEAFGGCYVTQVVFFIMMVLMLGSNGLYCVIKLHETEKLLFLGLLASSLQIFLTSENCFSTLQGL